MTWFRMSKHRANGKDIGRISIVGDIGGWDVTANAFRLALQDLGPVDELRLEITSDGGDVTVGYAIYNMLAAHNSYKIFTVNGLAASMASVILMAGDERIVPKNSMVMIHNPWGGITGGADEIISFGEGLKVMQANLVQSYVDATGLSRKVVRDMMDKTSWLSATQAKKLGFATKVVEPRELNASASRVVAKAQKKFPHVPASLGRNLGVKTMAKKPHTADDLDGSEFEAKTEAEIRTEILDEMVEVRALCKLAGYPDMADELIKANASRADVMKALEEAKAADDEEGDEEKPFPPKDKGKGKSELNTRRTSGEGNRSRREPVAIDHSAIYNRFNGRK